MIMFKEMTEEGHESLSPSGRHAGWLEKRDHNLSSLSVGGIEEAFRIETTERENSTLTEAWLRTTSTY